MHFPDKIPYYEAKYSVLFGLPAMILPGLDWFDTCFSRSHSKSVLVTTFVTAIWLVYNLGSKLPR
jgi:hypothetical protein